MSSCVFVVCRNIWDVFVAKRNVLLLLACFMASSVVGAADKTPEDGAGKAKSTVVFDSAAHQTVQQVMEQLLSAIEQNGALIDSQPEAYYASVDGVLGPVVDFEFISRVVMGRYGKKATLEQRKKFEQTFRRGLVVTYARGMAGYADQEITILPPDSDVSAQRRVSVRQQVRAASGDTHNLAYTMARKKETGDWKLINVVMDGINLGKTFRSQFEQAVKKNGGNIDTVISQWLSTDA